MTTTAPVIMSTVVPGSDEADVYGAIASGVTVLRDVARKVRFSFARTSHCAQRLRRAGLVRCKLNGVSHWTLGRDTHVAAKVAVLGVDSAVQRLLESGGSYTLDELVARTYAPIEMVAAKLDRMVVSRHAETFEAKPGEVRYRIKRKPMVTKNVVALFGFVPGDGRGEGDRKEDCARYEWCLKNYKLGGQAHCPDGCNGYQMMPVERFREAAARRRENNFTATGHY